MEMLDNGGTKQKLQFDDFVLDIASSEQLKAVPVEVTPLSDGQMDMKVTGRTSERMFVWETLSSTGFRMQRKERWVDAFILRNPRKGYLTYMRKNGRHEVAPGCASMFPYHSFEALEMSPGSHLFSCAIDQKALETAQTIFDGTASGCGLDFEPVICIDTPPLHALLQSFEALAKWPLNRGGGGGHHLPASQGHISLSIAWGMAENVSCRFATGCAG